MPTQIQQSQITPGMIKQQMLVAATGMTGGDMVYGNGSNNFTKLSMGATGKVLTAGATGPSWKDIPTQTLYRAFGFSNPGTQTVTNDVSWDPISPEAMTAKKLYGYAKTAPTGSVLTVRVWNITGATAVASMSFAAGSATGSTGTMSKAAIAQGDALRMDVTAIGATAAGADVSIVLEATQP